MRLRSLAFVVSLIALSATARAQEWANYGTISAEPTAGRICSGDANGKDIVCASTAPYVDPATGNVGIGTTTMTGKLNINAPSTQTAANAYGLYVDGAQSTANSSGQIGVISKPTYTAASGNTLASLVGVMGNPQNTNTGTVSTFSGLYGMPQNTAAGTVTNMYGVHSAPQNTSTGTVLDMRGVYGVPQNTSSGIVTNIFGIIAIPQNTSTGTVTSMFGLWSRCDNTNASGTVTSCFGLYLETPTTTGAITNKYGVYQVDTNSTNYFGGAVRLAASNYLNWGATAGTSGYGFRDNAGALEYKNSGGSWTALNAGTATNFAAGTVSAPGLYVTGDSNTGFYQATADSVSITAGGVEAARFNTAASGVNYLAVTPSATTAAVQISTAGRNSNISLALMPKGTGNVGIGTASPNYKLQIGDGTAATSAVIFGNGAGYNSGLGVWNASTAAGASAYLDFVFGGSYAAKAAIHARYQTNGSTDIILQGSNTSGTRSDMVYVDGSSSYVGIGTTAPAAKLDVVGTIKVADASDKCAWPPISANSATTPRPADSKSASRTSNINWAVKYPALIWSPRPLRKPRVRQAMPFRSSYDRWVPKRSPGNPGRNDVPYYDTYSCTSAIS